MILGINDILKGIFSIVPKLLYFIVACVLSLIDLCQVIFRKLAGLDPIIITDEVYTGDTLYKIIVDALFNNKYPAIRTVFWSLILLGVFMLFVTSIIALIRLEYNPDKDKGNSKSGVVKSFFKAIFSFGIVPIACLFGMYLCNALTGIIDKATAYSFSADNEISTCYDRWSAIEDSDSGSAVSNKDLLASREDSYMAFDVFGLHIPTTSEPFSGIVFRACAYNSNRIRNNEEFFIKLRTDECLGIVNKFNTQEDAASVIDTGFAINAKLKGKYKLNRSGVVRVFFYDCTDIIDIGAWNTDKLGSLSKYNVNAVYYFYDLWTFNYIIAFIAVITIGKAYYKFILILMQRLFETMGLFLISPISISLMPLDGGAALSTWRKTYIAKFALVVIMVLSLNLVSPLISICQSIKLFGVGVLDYIVLTFFMIAAINAMGSLNTLFAKILVNDDKLFEPYKDIEGSVTGSLSSGIKATAAGARMAVAPATLAARGGRAIVGGVMASRRNGREEDRRQRIRNANSQYSRDLSDLEDEQGVIAQDSVINDAEAQTLANNQSTFDQFNAQTGGLLERNEKNDRAMLNRYARQHYAFGKNKKDAFLHKTRLANDEAYRQQILDKMYAQDEEKKFNSFYKNDPTLSDEDNDKRRTSTLNMLRGGQAGLDAERDRIERNKNDIAARETARQASLTRIAAQRDATVKAIEREGRREKAVVRAKQIKANERNKKIGAVVNTTNKLLRGFPSDISTLMGTVPGTDTFKSSVGSLGIKGKGGGNQGQ